MIFDRRLRNIGNIPPHIIDFGIARQSLAERVIQQQQELLRNISISNLSHPLSSLNLHDVDSMVEEGEEERRVLTRTTKFKDLSIGFNNF